MAGHWAFGWDQVIGFANAGAVLVAAGVAVLTARWGINQWREEKLVGRQMELAEQGLALMYSAQEVFDDIRSPFAFAGEGSTRPRPKTETENETQERNSQYVPIERINTHSAFFDKIIELRPVLRAFFGEGAVRPFEEVLKLRYEIITAVRLRANFSRRTQPTSVEALEKQSQKIDEYESIIWKNFSEDDRFDERLSIAIENATGLLEPLLATKMRRSLSTDT